MIKVILALSFLVWAKYPTSIARADGKGHVNLEINYYAENSCIYFKEVRVGVPSSIEPTKRSLPVTVILDHKSDQKCEQKLKVITHSIQLEEKPGINSAEIFYIGTDGRFIRSAKPRIYRGSETDDEA